MLFTFWSTTLSVRHFTKFCSGTKAITAVGSVKDDAKVLVATKISLAGDEAKSMPPTIRRNRCLHQVRLKITAHAKWHHCRCWRQKILHFIEHNDVAKLTTLKFVRDPRRPSFTGKSLRSTASKDCSNQNRSGSKEGGQSRKEEALCKNGQAAQPSP